MPSPRLASPSTRRGLLLIEATVLTGGTPLSTPTVHLGLDDRYLREEGSVFLTGVQAIVRFLLDQRRSDRAAGLRTAGFVSGYPGSPLAGLDLELERQRALMSSEGVLHRPGVNEELAATAVEGTQLVQSYAGARHQGVFGVWYGKAPGLDRATDAIRHANLMGTHARGGVVALVGDDPTAKSSTVPSASEGGLYDLGLPVLYPGDPQEVLDFGLHAIAMSRSCGLWAGMKLATNVADGMGTIEVGEGRVRPALPELTLDGRPYRHRPSGHVLGAVLMELERSLLVARLDGARQYGALNHLNQVVRSSPADWIGIVAAGKTYLDVRQALAGMGLDDEGLTRHGIRLLKLGLPFPLDEALVRRFGAGLRQVVVVEEKRPFVELFVKDALYGVTDRPVVVGRRDERGAPLIPGPGELDPDSIAAALGPRLLAGHEIPSVLARLDGLARLESLAKESVAAGTPLRRSAYFCSGCPHNRSAQVPDGALVGGGIGCHGMVLLMSPRQVGEVTGLTQMGGEGAQWIGMAPFTEREHLFQNIGDGTFAHSGSLAVRAAVAAGVNLTFKLLYNRTVAMTGGQDPTGGMPVDRLTHLLAAEGVVRIIVTTEDPSRYDGAELAPLASVWARDRLLEAQQSLAGQPGVTVLIHDQECAAEKRRKRKRGRLEDPALRVLINEQLCEGCGDCGRKSNCLSVHPVDTEYGRKTQIHQASCNKDYSCLLGDCPSFLTVLPARNGSGGRARARASSLGADAAPASGASPPAVAPQPPFAMRITGIGGTGVVTVSQILGTAARLDGLFVRGLDQTGLAQKGGPVVSDLRFSTTSVECASKLSAGECDLYLGFDLLVAADQRNLSCADPQRTVAVLSTTRVPTGAMVSDPTVDYPDAEGILARIDRHTRGAGARIALDARGVAETLFGSDTQANLLLVGAAWQAGALPVSASAIEAAIELNGAAVEANRQAFRRGRQAVHDPEALQAELDRLHPRPVEPAIPPAAREIARIVGPTSAPGSTNGDLGRVVARRVADLTAYQDAGYARRYAELVERVRRVEAERCPGRGSLAETVAHTLHRLMAYKDEYEVARLSLDPAFVARVEAEFGEGARVAYQLHPPALRALGLDRKLSLGPWFKPAFRALRAMRHLRHTALDPFRYMEVRKVERELVVGYAHLVEEILATLEPATHDRAVELAGLADMVKGFEGIKLESVGRYRARLAELRGEHGAFPADPGSAVAVVAGSRE